MYRRRKRTVIRWTGVALALCLAGTAWAQDAASPQQQVTGKGGHYLHYSSTQVEIALTEPEQQALLRERDHRYGASLEPAMNAVAQALQAQGYTAVTVDRDFHVIEARHDEVLVSEAREVLRGALKARMPLPAKPDHQSTEALILLTPAPDGQGVLARTRFRRTVWDSNGDARTQLLSDAAVYQQFYAAVATRLPR